jgi:zinc transport system substrate-binding protein
MRVIIILTASGALVAAGCGGSARSGREEIVAGFYPLAFAAQEVGGARVEVRDLTPAGVEPHDLELSPRDVQAVRSADLVLLLGHGFQPQVEKAAGSGERVLRLLDIPRLRLLPGDPHVWLDPVRYALIVRGIGRALHRRRAADRLVTRLQSLDVDYRRGLSGCARREIVTSHEAFSYLAQRYGLKEVAITGLSPEAEPTPRRLSHVIDLVRSTHARTIFFERLVSPRIADTVARETGARTAVLDPIEGLTPGEERRGDNYFSLMRANLAALRKALGCR